MASRFESLRAEAVKLRIEGYSLKAIRLQLGIPLSTLSGWLRSVELTPEQKERLHENWVQGLAKARSCASRAHREARIQRDQQICVEAESFVQGIDRKNTLEIALAFLYAGEGGKTKNGLQLGNSNAAIIRFYVSALRDLYGIQPVSLGAALHLRDDQDEVTLKEYWSKETGIPLERFGRTLRDKRTVGKPTYSEYKGVCSVMGGGVAIQRRLLYIAKAFMRG